MLISYARGGLFSKSTPQHRPLIPCSDLKHIHCNQTHQLSSSEAYQELSFGFVVVLPPLLSQLIRSAVPQPSSTPQHDRNHQPTTPILSLGIAMMVEPTQCHHTYFY
eukprot:scaffold109412_cov36-Cyclotella_meneghiniana.AAC.1